MSAILLYMLIKEMKYPRIMAVTLAIITIAMPAPHAAVIQESGDFVTEVERLRDLAFAKDSGLYIPPSSQQQSNFMSMANSLFLGEIETADSMAAALEYEVVEFTDTNAVLVLHGLREVLHGGEQTNGWGSFFVNLSSEVADLIEAPHPLFDSYSWDVAARTFVDARAQAFLIAGAHRNANGTGTADVAHLTNTIFHAVHQAWNGENGQNVAWQIHGFNTDTQPSFPTNTDAVLSNGDGGISSEIINIDASFHTNGFLSYAYNTLATNSAGNLQVNDGIPGTTFSPLGATLNVQGIHSRSIGGIFIHVELEQSIRFSSANRASAAALLSDSIRASSRVAPQIASFDLTTWTSAVMQVNNMVRTREYQILERTNLMTGNWNTGITISASTSSTNLPVAISSEWDRIYFKLLLE